MLVVSWNGRKVRLFANGKVKGHFTIKHPEQKYVCPIYFGAVPHGGGNIGAFKGFLDQARSVYSFTICLFQADICSGSKILADD